MPSRFVFNLAPTGVVPTKEVNPSVPTSSSEIAEQVLECAELGVNMVHLHARDPQTGEHSPDKTEYARIIAEIRRHAPTLLICVTTSGREVPQLERRAAVLELDGHLKPDFASLTLSSLNFSHEASVNAPETILGLVRRMRANGIRPELEVFDLGMVNYAHYLLAKGLIAPPHYFNVILGGPAGAQADPLHLGLMVRDLPDGSIWSGGGFGHHQLSVNTMALASGGGIRVGLEDNLWMDSERSQPATNRQLVERARETAELLGRHPYTSAELRDALGLAALH
ncbi:MAG: 3-keto-5-aminohexanoate cleavage protein [Thiohalocapsa sp. PB-PSB1]|jgi:3-keto-5-aminohexanoate cleavage enzyme|nr:MAG: hypothetical protein N838_04305 [Thiohalocapsa sp. PB-PSB1]QQO55364.1 MAG: 3-keto-5-aminohexanoate cleavage protein [Thiohalocapsa sp. PB-PSB1]HCS90683.1 3-keto-5-aminohexanoate cleavage protein [Chromatiaceae bacterium]